MLAVFVWCLVVSLVTRALCLMFDCYVSDAHSILTITFVMVALFVWCLIVTSGDVRSLFSV